MTNPNIVNTTSVTATTSVQEVTTSPASIVENTASSGQLHKINSLLLANYAEGEESVVIGFDLENASYDNVSFSVSSEDVAPLGIVFNTDGTKMYVVGNASDSVHQYTLTTGFDLTTASYDNVSFSVASEETKPEGIVFNTDGTKMYVVGNASVSVHQYTLTTGFDLTTASYDNVSFSVASEDGDPKGIFFSDGGNKMFVPGAVSGSVHQYTLTTGFDLTTASYDNVSFDVSSEEDNPQDLVFNSDGTKMFITGDISDSVHQYTLTTGFDLTTASYDNVSFDVSSEDSSFRGLTSNADGTKIFISGRNSSSVHSYTTGSVVTTSGGGSVPVTVDVYRDGTPYHVAKDIAVPTNATVAAITKDTGIYLEEGDSLRCTAGENAAIHGICSYEIISAPEISNGGGETDPTEWLVDLSIVTYDNVSFSVASLMPAPTGFAFKPDGTKMYIVGENADSVFQYTLSTPWDMSTASYDSVSFSIASEGSAPQEIKFKPDGTKMYMEDFTTKSVFQYTLSTAWDLSTAVYDSVSFNINAETTAPLGFEFKPDGTKMYIASANPDAIFQYTLSTSWDLTTASYDSVSFSIAEDSTVQGVRFSPSGDIMYVVGVVSDSVHQYTLSTPWDVSTASYDSISFDFGSQDSNPREIAFDTNGSKMYIMGQDNEAVLQYTSG